VSLCLLQSRSIRLPPFWETRSLLAVLKMEEGLAEVITEVLDARVDDDGRVTFSMAGVEGFHVTHRCSGQVSLGYGDTLFAFNRATRVPSSSGGSRRLMRCATPSSARAPASSNLLRDLVVLGVRVVQYPLFWVLVIMALIGKIALVLANSRQTSAFAAAQTRAAQPKAKSTSVRARASSSSACVPESGCGRPRRCWRRCCPVGGGVLLPRRAAHAWRRRERPSQRSLRRRLLVDPGRQGLGVYWR
jgi:hypothetical protein